MLSKKTTYTLISICVAAAVIIYLFSHITLQQVWDLIIQADRRGLVMFLIMSFSMSIFRTWRYSVLLSLAGERPRSIPLFLVVLVRNFCSDLLPARMGSLIYIPLLTSRLKVSLDQAASSFALALVFDVLSIVPLVLLALVFLEPTAEMPTHLIAVSGVVFLILSILFVKALPWLLSKSSVIIKKINFLPVKPRDYLADLLNKVDADIQHVRDAGLYGRVFLLSILLRICKYAGLYFVLYALVKNHGYTFSDLPPAKVFFGLCVPEFVASLPISGIAGIGAYQGAWVFVFEYLGFPGDLAKVTSVSHHILTQSYGYTLGALALVTLSLPVFRNASDGTPSQNRIEPLWSFAVKITLYLLATTTILYLLAFYQVNF